MDYGEIHFQMSRIREVVSIIHGLYFVNDKVNPVYTAQYIPSYRHYKELYETLSPGNS